MSGLHPVFFFHGVFYTIIFLRGDLHKKIQKTRKIFFYIHVCYVLMSQINVSRGGGGFKPPNTPLYTALTDVSSSFLFCQNIGEKLFKGLSERKLLYLVPFVINKT